tara:strand:- start:60 stop:230 length:171 start_codon:yes stop_codon:yes gene_type:complete
MTFTYKYINDPITGTKSTNTILRKEDNAFIPFDEANTDYQEYLEWVAEGNTAEEAD